MQRNFKSIYLLTLVAVSSILIFAACNIEGEENYSFRPHGTLAIAGETEVESGAKGVEFSVLGYTVAKTYNWTVSGPAAFDGESTGEIVALNFTAPQNDADTIVTLTVTNSENYSGSTSIVVQRSTPTATYSLERGTAIKSGGLDTVVIVFSKPLTNVPTLTLIASDGVSGGSIGPVMKVTVADTAKLDVKNLTRAYYAIYTGGNGNGTQDFVVSDAIATPEFGGQTFVNDTSSIINIDNTPPTGYISYSSSTVKTGDSVKISSTFSEPVTGDDTIRITVSGPSIASQTGNMKATDDAAIWEYWYKPSGSSTEVLSINLTGVTDIAGNSLTGTIGNSQHLKVDNKGPVISGATATDMGAFASLDVSSDEKGTIHYIILERGEDPPVTGAEFLDNEQAVSMGSSEVLAGGMASYTSALDAGSYDVYFISTDEAGNWSTIQKVDLEMN